MADDHSAAIQDILALVATEFRTTPLDLISARQGDGIARKRHIAMWLARHTLGATYAGIGRAIGDRHHTSVLYGIDRVNTLRRVSPDLTQHLDWLIRVALVAPVRTAP